jgi:hypothetical protein
VSSESSGQKTVEVVPDGEFRVVNGRKYGAGVKIVTGAEKPVLTKEEVKDADE